MMNRVSLAALLLLIMAPALAAERPVGDALQSPAMRTVHPERAVFIDLARAGERLVAVGERGLILLSDDHGQTWRQVPVPVSVGLTAVHFVDADHGWALGHAGVILASQDAGQTWTVQMDNRRATGLGLEIADKPFLALAFADARHGLVVGAYGLALRTDDGGQNWRSIGAQIDNPDGMHLYAVARQGRQWFVAGEQGYLARSADGEHFQMLQTPYAGTFFTLGLRADGTLLVGGLKGHAFTLAPESDALQPLKAPAPVSFSSITRLQDGRSVFANQAGGLFDTLPGSTALRPLLTAGKPVASLVEAADGSLVSAGFSGLNRLALPAAPVSE